MKRHHWTFVVAAVIVVLAVTFWPRPVDLAQEGRSFWKEVADQGTSSATVLIGERPMKPEDRPIAVKALQEVAGPFRFESAISAHRFSESQGLVLRLRTSDGKEFDLPTQAVLVEGKAAIDFESALMIAIGIRRHQPGEEDGTLGKTYTARQIQRFRDSLAKVPFRHLRINGESFASWDEVIAAYQR